MIAGTCSRHAWLPIPAIMSHLPENNKYLKICPILSYNLSICDTYNNAVDSGMKRELKLTPSHTTLVNSAVGANTYVPAPSPRSTSSSHHTSSRKHARHRGSHMSRSHAIALALLDIDAVLEWPETDSD